MSAPLLIMLAGPNGAGKSTFYESHLAALGLPFLNADILAHQANMDAYTAANTIAAIRDQRIAAGQAFVTETVFSDPLGEKVEVLRKAATRGFDVTLIYIGLNNADLSHQRVKARVAAGGHDVPVEKLAARYTRSMTNLDRAIQRLPRLRVYDNSSFEKPYRFLGEFINQERVAKTDGLIPEWARHLFR